MLNLVVSSTKKGHIFMKKISKIISFFMALLMVVSCVPMTAFAKEKDRDTSSLDKYLSTENLATVVEDLLNALGTRKKDFVPSALNLCFQTIDALKETAQENNVNVFDASTEQLAGQFIVYLDKVITEEDLNSVLPWYVESIGSSIGVTINLRSVDSILQTLVDVGAVFKNPPLIAVLAGFRDFGDAKNLDVSMFVKEGKTAISTKNSKNLDIIYAIFDFLSTDANIEFINKIISGKLDLGSANDAIKMLAEGLDIEAEVTKLFGNIQQSVNELLYDNLIAGEEDPAFAESVYVGFSSDELLAAALLKQITGEDASQAECKKLAGMTLYQMIGKYADVVIANIILEPLNNDFKESLKELIASDPQLKVLEKIINMNYEFKKDTFNFAEMAKEGLFENLNNIVCTIAKVVLQPKVYSELGLKKGGNENVTANLTSVFAYILKTLATNNGGKLELTVEEKKYSFDFSGFTADNIADKSLEDMFVAVVGLFYPNLLQVKLPSEVKTLEQLVGYTAYVAIDKYMVDSKDVDFNKDYKNLVLSNGKVKNLSQAQWNNVIGEMGMDVAIYWLNDATNFGMTQAEVDALKAKGWTWEDFFEEIVDWALNYIKGIPAVADKLEIERGVSDGYGAWYKLNVVLNELFPLAFINGCGDETFTFDVYTAVMKKIVPSLYDCDYAAFADVLATNNKKDNPFNQPLIASVIEMADHFIFSIFEHECVKTANFETQKSVGTYCVENGHYISVTAKNPVNDEKPTDPTTKPPVTNVMLGDVTGDGKITAADARLVLRVSAKLESLEDAKFKAGDVTGDNKITAADARKILRVSAKLDSFD